MDFFGLINSLLGYLNVPSLALLVMFIGAFQVLHAAQKRDDFDLGNMLRNAEGKESAAALGVIVAIILSGWALVYDTYKVGHVDQDILMIYLGFWSGTKVAEKFADVLASKTNK